MPLSRGSPQTYFYLFEGLGINSRRRSLTRFSVPLLPRPLYLARNGSAELAGRFPVSL